VNRALYPEADIGGEFGLEGRTFVADEQGEVLGYASLRWHGRRAELEPIVVARASRERGVGRTLVQRVVQEARDGGAVRIFVRPAARNREAIMFFHSVGFDVLGYIELQIDFEPREREMDCSPRFPRLVAGRFRVGEW
jgi:N-acetylglutamate synthase-like GNAT family acetyltransferase